LPHLLIALEAPNAPDLGEELGQRLLIKKLAKEGFIVNTFEYHATIEFPNVAPEFADAIDSDVADWITFKHSSLKKRKLAGGRKKTTLDNSNENGEQLICIEVRPNKFR
jgi:hypothetical protein